VPHGLCVWIRRKMWPKHPVQNIYLCNRKKVGNWEQAVFSGGNWFRFERRIRSNTGTFPKKGQRTQRTFPATNLPKRRKGCAQSGSVGGVLVQSAALKRTLTSCLVLNLWVYRVCYYFDAPLPFFFATKSEHKPGFFVCFCFCLQFFNSHTMYLPLDQ